MRKVYQTTYLAIAAVIFGYGSKFFLLDLFKNDVDDSFTMPLAGGFGAANMKLHVRIPPNLNVTGSDIMPFIPAIVNVQRSTVNHHRGNRFHCILGSRHRDHLRPPHPSA